MHQSNCQSIFRIAIGSHLEIRLLTLLTMDCGPSMHITRKDYESQRQAGAVKLGDEVKGADTAYAKAVSERLQRAAGELRALEVILTAGLVDKRVLREFRDAMDQMRGTSW